MELTMMSGNKTPIFGFVARLTSQKGLDLILPLVPRLIKKEQAKFYFLGQGQEEYEKALLVLAKKYPKNVKVKIGFDEKLARKIYKQSDFFLMPSIFEPSGLGQMISMHYGTIPIVRATGGLKDTVKNLKTGFVFKQKSSSSLYEAIKTALKYFHSPEKLEKIRQNCLKEDFSWEKSALLYKKLYNSLTK
jgi:starch synthase